MNNFARVIYLNTLIDDQKTCAILNYRITYYESELVQ